MATLDELSTALVNADKAGDVEGATALANEIKRQRTTAQAAPAPAIPAPKDDVLSLLKRQAGLTGRYLLEGATALPNIPFDAGVKLWNMATGGSAETPSEAQARLMNQAGLPNPQTGAERAVSYVSRALVPVGGQIGAASQVAAKAVNPLARSVSTLLAQAPGAQATSAAIGGAAGGAAAELGASPLTQSLVSLGAGSAPALAFAPAAIRATQRPAPYTGDAAARLEAMRAVGIEQPPLAAITRSPQEWAKWQEFGKRDGGAKAAFAERGNAINQQLSDFLPSMRALPESTPAQQAADVQAGVQAYKTDARDVASGTYQAAERAPGADVPVPWEPFRAAIQPTLDKYSDVIPGAVRSRIEAFGPQSITHTESAPAPAAPPSPTPSVGKRLTSRIIELGGLNKQEASDTFGETGLAAARQRPALFQTSRAVDMAGTRKGNSLSTLVHDGQLDEYLPFDMRAGSGAEDEAVQYLRDSIASDMAGSHVGPYENMLSRAQARGPSEAPPAPTLEQSVTYGAPFTVGEMSKLYQLINDRMGRASGAAAPAGAELKRALGDYGLAQSGDAGNAMQLFKDATTQWRAMSQNLAPRPIAMAAGQRELSPEFLQRLFTAGRPGEMTSLAGLLGENAPAARATMHDALLDLLRSKATQSATGQFSGAQLGKAIDRVGPERIASVLSPDEIKRLEQLRTAATALTVEPSMANVNRSNTTSALFNAIRKPQAMPLLGTVLGGLLGHTSGVAVGGELAGYAAGRAASTVADKLAAERMARMYLQKHPQEAADILQRMLPYFAGASGAGLLGLSR